MQSRVVARVKDATQAVPAPSIGARTRLVVCKYSKCAFFSTIGVAKQQGFKWTAESPRLRTIAESVRIARRGPPWPSISARTPASEGVVPREHYLGYKVAAFEASGYQFRDYLMYVTHTEIGQQVGRFALRGDCTLFFFIFADTSRARPEDIGEQKRLLQQRFGDSGRECPQILNALDSAEDLYFDRVSQIRMASERGLAWTHGRVGLVGDAAWCVSLLAGQGSGIAMAGGYILAGELHRAGGDYRTAFAGYENRFATFVVRKQ